MVAAHFHSSSGMRPRDYTRHIIQLTLNELSDVTGCLGGRVDMPRMRMWFSSSLSIETAAVGSLAFKTVA